MLGFTWNASLKASTSRQKASSRESLVRLVLFEEVRMVRMLSSRLSSGASVPLTRLVSLDPTGASMAVSSDFLIITFTVPYNYEEEKEKLCLYLQPVQSSSSQMSHFFIWEHSDKSNASWTSQNCWRKLCSHEVGWRSSFFYPLLSSSLFFFAPVARQQQAPLVIYKLIFHDWSSSTTITICSCSSTECSRQTRRPDTYLKADLVKPLTCRSGWCSLHLDKAEIVESEILQTILSILYFIVCCNGNYVCPYTSITQIKPGIQAPSRSISYLSDNGRPWPCFHPRLA